MRPLFRSSAVRGSSSARKCGTQTGSGGGMVIMVAVGRERVGGGLVTRVRLSCATCTQRKSIRARELRMTEIKTEKLLEILQEECMHCTAITLKKQETLLSVKIWLYMCLPQR